MSNTAHTPGPWDTDGITVFYAAPSEVDEVTMIEIRANVTKDGWHTVAFIEAAWPGAQANAQLIAMAPEMFAFIECSAGFLESHLFVGEQSGT